MDEVLLGCPLIKALPCDAIDHLETFRDNYESTEFSAVAPMRNEGVKISRVIPRLEHYETHGREKSVGHEDKD